MHHAPIWEHPKGRMHSVSHRNIKAQPCSQIRPPEHQRALRAWAHHLVCGKHAADVGPCTGLQPLPGQRLMLQVTCQAGVEGGR